jgi:hypothetical protein
MLMLIQCWWLAARGGRQVSLHYVGDAGRARKGAAQRRVLLQEPARVDARAPRYGSDKRGGRLWQVQALMWRAGVFHKKEIKE